MAKAWIIRLSAGYGFLPVAVEVDKYATDVSDELTKMMGNKPDSEDCWKAVELDAGYLLVFHNQQNPQIVDPDKAKMDTYNPMASGLANESVRGIAAIVRPDGEGNPCSLDDDEVGAAMPVLSSLFDRFCRVDPGPYDVAKLCFVEEIDPGRGFAYFSVGVVPHGFFIGWDRAPAVQYAEAPRSFENCRIVTVVYDCPQLVLPNDVKAWSGWSADAINEGRCHWLESRDGAVKLDRNTSISDFVKAVRDLGGIVYIQEKTEQKPDRKEGNAE